MPLTPTFAPPPPLLKTRPLPHRHPPKSHLQDTSKKPRLLVLPGLDGADVLLDAFRTSVSSANDSHRVTAAVYPNEPFSLPQLASHIAQKHLSIPDRRGTILLAQSFSGLVALHLAKHPPAYPPLATILINGFVSSPVPGWVKWVPMPVELFKYHPPARLVAPMFLGEGVEMRRKISVMQRAGGRNGIEVMRKRIEICLEENLWHVWHDRGVLPGGRTLYLRGGRDRVVGKRFVERMRLARPDVEWVEVENGPHMLLQAVGGECGRVVNGFCERVVRDERDASIR